MNPYNVISPDVNSAGGQQSVFGPNGHAGHTGTPPGSLFTPGVSQNGDDWGDIIPPFDYLDSNGVTQHYNGLNWTAQGQAIWNNNCAAPAAAATLAAPQKSGPASVAVGSSANHYTITTSNTGGSAASNVTISDQVASGLTVTDVSWTKSNPSATGSCAATQNVSCNVGTLSAGQSVSVTITFSVAAAACPGPLSNTASVSATAIASMGSNTVSTNLTNCPAGAAPDIAISKSGPSSATEGTPYSYTITVSNLGSASAVHPITMDDTLPAGLLFQGMSHPGGWTCTTPAVGAPGSIACSTANDMAAGDSAQFGITVLADGSVCGRITNTAVTSSQSANDADPTNESDSKTTVVSCLPDVTLTKAGGPTGNVSQTPAGIQLSYTITASNGGNGAAPKTQVVDDLNDQLTSVTASILGNPPGNPSCVVAAGNVVTCGTFTLASVNSPNDSAQIAITALVPAGVCTTVNNTATGTVHTNDPNQAPIPSSNTLTTTITGCGGGPGGGSPALSITKTATPASVNVGGAVSYSITVASVGSAPADNVVVHDTLPSVPGTTWAITGGSGAGMCSLLGNALSCSFGTMTSPPQTSLSVVVSSTSTTSASCGRFANTASASATGVAAVTSSATATVSCANGLHLVKNGPASAAVGDTITYTFEVTLQGGSAPLSGVSLTDPRCDPFSMNGPTGDDGNGILESGETWHYACTHRVTANDPDPLPNTATVCAGTVCDSADHEVDIRHPDIDLTKHADPTSGTAGTVITYTYSVRNSGDVPLHHVTVDDDVLGHICTIALLQPHTTVVCTGSYRIPRGAPASVTNIAIAGGTDPAGTVVSDRDRAVVDVVGAVVVSPTETKSPAPGLAFTGSAGVIPLATLALVLLTIGSGLLFATRRRRVPTD